MGALLVSNALAVHDENFQLDGDVSASTTTNFGGHTQTFDWDSFFNAAGEQSPVLPDPSRPGFDASSFDRDFNTANGSFSTSDSSTYATGSKDTLAITPGWQCNQDNNVNSKIDVMNAYATSYTAGGQEFLYFALERNANTGTADVGFWFLQDENVNCESPGGTTAFTGDHVDGDLLVVSEFTAGGTVSTINVYRWDGGANGSLNPTPVSTGADCRTTPLTGAADRACGRTNTGTITTPWLTSNKQDGVGHSLRISEFFEGGINLTESGLGGRCFNTFIADTRSSTSLTATLFDYSRGRLGECTSDTTTTPSITSQPIPAHGTLDVTDSAKVDVTGVSSFSGDVTFFLCRESELADDPDTPDPAEVCASGGTQIGTAKSVTSSGQTVVSDVAGLTAAEKYCWRAEFSGDDDVGVPASSDSSSGECFTVTPLTPNLTTDATDGPVDFGTAISDTIMLSGTADTPGTNGIGPGGTINATNRSPADNQIHVTAFGPDDCSTSAHTADLNVSGDGTYGGPGSVTEFTPTAPGTYTYVASYDGDSPNTNGAGPTACPDPTGAEAVTVQQIPTVTTTRQFVFPQDKVKIDTNPTGQTLSGNVVFRLFEATDGVSPKTALENCLADDGTATATGLVYDEGPISISGAGPQFATTNNNDYRITDGRTYVWRVIYSSSIQSQLGSSSNCTENTTVTFAGDDSSIDIP